MAYFDDAKNRESWEKAMEGLRRERERRLSGEEPGAVISARDLGRSAHMAAEERIPVSFQQILDEYQRERAGKATPAPAMEKQQPAMDMEREREKEMAGPELKKQRPVG